MTALKDFLLQNPPLSLALGGLAIGFLFGFLVYRTNFCTMGSISDMMTFGDYRRFRAWLLAGATAMLGTQLLQYYGAVSLTRSMYLGTNLNWFGNIVGGLLFGFGMVFAGGCASRNLARAGGGDLRSLLSLLVVGLFAYMAIGGLLGPIRATLEQWTTLSLAPLKLPSQSLGDVLSVVAGLSSRQASLIMGSVIALLMALYCFKDASFRSSPVHVISGLGIGLCVVLGWGLTGLAFDEMAERPTQPISLTYVRPTGDAIEWLQRFTAARMPGFGVASVFGAMLGAFIAAISMGRFQVTTFSDKGDTLRNLFGAMLMGIGGVMSLGCTVGQAITGISTLAMGSFLTFAAIVVGGRWGMKVFERILLGDD